MQNLYHEKQSLALCGLHAVNNLLQKPAYNKQDFDNFASQLHTLTGGNPSLISQNIYSPYKSFLGHYDIHVIEKALSQAGFDVTWHDMRRTLANVCQDFKNLPFLHLLINIKSRWTYLPLKKSDHWVTVVSKNDRYFYIDSKLDEIEEFLNLDEFLTSDILREFHFDKSNFVAVTILDSFCVLAQIFFLEARVNTRKILLFVAFFRDLSKQKFKIVQFADI